MLGRFGLLLATVAVMFLLLEAGLRVAERITTLDLFHVMRSEEVASDTSELRARDFIQRSPNSELMYELNPSVVGLFEGSPVAINPDGLRGPRVPVRRGTPETLRIVGLGDSVLFGWGVAEPDALLSRIRTTLAERHPKGLSVETINLAVPGYNTHQEVEAFAAKGLAYDPDLVLLLFVGNDHLLPNAFHHRPGFFATERSYLLDFLEVRTKLLFRGKRFQNRYMPRGLAGLRDVRPAFAADGSNDPVPEELRHMVGMDAVERALRRLADLSAEASIPVVFSWIAPAAAVTLEAAEIARSLGFQVVDMDRPISDFRVETSTAFSALRVSDEDPHPSPLHHQLMADVLLEAAIEPWYERQSPPAQAARQ